MSVAFYFLQYYNLTGYLVI